MTTLTISIIVVFVLGYALIATESLTKVNKAAIALLMLVGCWTLYMVDPMQYLQMMHPDYTGGAAGMVEKVTVYEEKFMVEFKSGTSVDVER